MNRPLCRCCGKQIAKRTTDLFFYEGSGTSSTSIHVEALPRTREEVQAFTNQQVISIARYRNGGIWRAGTWDGVSYRDDTFCSLKCEAHFGRSMAITFPTYAMPAYHAAVAKQRERSPA